MNLPEIGLVVVYSLLITMDLSDLMQRIVRAAGTAGCMGDTIFFLPYLLFSDYGEDKPRQTPLPMDKGNTRGKRRMKKTCKPSILGGWFTDPAGRAREQRRDFIAIIYSYAVIWTI